MTTVNVHEAKTHLSRLLERAHAGEEIIIAKNGKPFFNLIAKNKQIIGTSQMYASKASMENGIASVKANAPDAKVDDQT